MRHTTSAWAGRIGFSLHGVTFGVRYDDPTAEVIVRAILPRFALPSDYRAAEHRLTLVTRADAESNGLFFDSRNFETVHTFDVLDAGTSKGLETKFQFAIAVAAVPRLFFMHAGAVAFGDRGVLVTGPTRAGKTTLVGELLKRGAKLYTDDCAIVDPLGNLYPNAAPLAVRAGGDRLFREPEEFGSAAADEVVPISLVVSARYEAGAVWEPAADAAGTGAFRLLDSLFYPPAIREFPRETLEFATRLSERGTYSGVRGEAAEVAGWIGRMVAGERT